MKSEPQLPTGTWHLDTAATTVTVSAKHLLALTVPATLTVTSGSIEIADNQVVRVGSKLDLTVSAAATRTN